MSAAWGGAMKTCSTCGYEVSPEDLFCSNCGTRQAKAEAESRSAGDVAFDGQPSGAAAINYGSAAGAYLTQPDPTTQPRFPAAQGGWPPPGSEAVQDRYAPPPSAPGQFPPGQYAPPGGPAASDGAYAPPPAVNAPSGFPAPAGFGAPQAVTVCPNCGQGWTGLQSCTFCGQVRGLPNGISVSSAGRRFGGYLLEGLLFVCTLAIGWVIWSLIVWTQGQTPAKQVLGMRVVRLDTRTHAGWGRMFLREIIGKFVVSLVGSLVLIGVVIADLWLLWDKDKQELWDKIAGTVVVNDPEKRLIP